MKKILFVLYNFNIGGIQKALLNLIKSIYNDYEIYIFAFYPYGIYRKEYEMYANILNTEKKFYHFGISRKEAKKIGRLFYIIHIILKIFARLFTNKIIIKLLGKKKIIDFHFDFAISYAQNGKKNSLMCGANHLVLYNFNSSIKSAFIHGDYINSGLNINYYNNEYYKFDYVFSVSKSCSEVAQKILGINVYTIENVIIEEEIKQLAYEYDINIDCNKSKYIFVTVCRLSPEKGIDRMIKIFGEILNERNNFLWIIVGGGNIDCYKKMIIKYNLTDNVLLIGEKTNPYPYMLISDFLLISSYYEAAPLVVDEAKVLNKRIISTKYLAYKDQLNIIDDIIINNNDNDIKEQIINILRTPKNKICFKRSTKFKNNGILKFKKYFK